jgi:hypothetical protein
MCFPLTPFKIEREWEAFGLKCAVVQNREGMHRCGYVRLPSGHPAWGLSYDNIDVDVHGGLTFCDLEPCIEEDGQGYWVGFDCRHAYDRGWDPDFDPLKATTQEAAGAYIAERDFHCNSEHRFGGEHYWTHDEVVAETERLAAQLADYKENRVENIP